MKNAASTDSNGRRQHIKLGKTLWFMAGSICLSFGLAGVVLPILPTTPFLLAAAACYLKSSEKAHRWLFRNRVFGEYLKNYKEGKGLSTKTKIGIGLLLWATIAFSIISLKIIYVQVGLVIVAIAVSLHIMSLPTLKKNLKQRIETNTSKNY